MPFSDEILQAAQELGARLGETDCVQGYLQAEADCEADQTFHGLEAALIERYQQLTARQQNGEVLSPYEINQYHNLHDQVRRHPLYGERDARLKALRLACSQTAQAMSSLLTIDYTQLVGE